MPHLIPFTCSHLPVNTCITLTTFSCILFTVCPPPFPLHSYSSVTGKHPSLTRSFLPSSSSSFFEPISLYHDGIYFNIFPAAASSCTEAVKKILPNPNLGSFSPLKSTAAGGLHRPFQRQDVSECRVLLGFSLIIQHSIQNE